jgi:hypothetical protein
LPGHIGVTALPTWRLHRVDPLSADDVITYKDMSMLAIYKKSKHNLIEQMSKIDE